MSDCGCHHEAKDAGERRILVIALALNALMAVVGGVAGWIGQSTGLLADALDMLSDAAAYAIGLANRLVPDGQALEAALDLAGQLSAFPQTCLRNDRASAIAQWSMDWDAATRREVELGRATLASGEAAAGAARFVAGQGRGGAF